MSYVIHWTDECSLKQRYQENTRHIKHNKPQLAYVLHILHNKHKYGPINNNMTLLKHIDKTTLLLPYEQLYIQSYHYHKQLIPQQHIGEHNPMYQLIYKLHNMSCPTRPTDQCANINTTKNQFHPNPASSQPTNSMYNNSNVRTYCIS
jgi:hypothetical protein